ncbi:MAG: hypothetical protein BWX55_00217 [Deltaproteobacteria bacterium ADurb.Bin022]|nr:MAG: hypothetical protein BWX55_00217 [Deltaproteobacteria bacterium ADurb.Bin022]
MIARLQSFHQPQLLFRSDARENGCVPRCGDQFFVGQFFKILAGQCLRRTVLTAFILPDVQLAGDFRGRDRVVPGNHFNHNPRLVTGRNGCNRLRAGRINHPLQSQKCQTGKAVFDVQIFLVDFLAGQRENAQSFARHGIHPGE